MTKIEQEIKVLEQKLAQSRERIAQAEKQYKNALAGLEKQKKAVETARLDIDRVKVRIANRLTTLQGLKESVSKKAAEQAQQAQTYSFTVNLDSVRPEVIFDPQAKPVKL